MGEVVKVTLDLAAEGAPVDSRSSEGSACHAFHDLRPSPPPPPQVVHCNLAHIPCCLVRKIQLLPAFQPLNQRIHGCLSVSLPVGSPSGPVIEFLEEWNTEALAEISPDVMITATKVGDGYWLLSDGACVSGCQGLTRAKNGDSQRRACLWVCSWT